jgi:hypothetical protein
MLLDYNLPAHWAPALINGDESGLDDKEVKILHRWLKAEEPGECIDVTDEPAFMSYHDAYPLVLPCDCLLFTFRQEEIF